MARRDLERGRERDLIEAGLNEAAGWLGAMGIAPLTSWPRTRERGLEACAEDGLDGSSAAIELGDVDRHEETHDGIARGATGSVEDDDVGGGLRSRCHDVSQ